MFWFSMFMSGLILASIVHLSLRMGFLPLRQWIRDHDLFTMFLLGALAGLPVLGSRFTGRGWFRSKSGHTYEGFKLENIKRWMWLLISPVLLLGIVAWIETRGGMGGLSGATSSKVYHELLMPDCSSGGLLRYRGDTTCSMNLLTVGTWLASVGYSLAPIIRSRGAKLLRGWRTIEGEAAES
jgi:hypothetical protein